MTIRDARGVLRRMLVLSRYVLDGFNAENGNQRDPGANGAMMRRFDLLGELYPAERAFLLGPGDVTSRQITDATSRSEALRALRWAVGDVGDLPVGGQVSLMQAIPALGSDDEILARLAGTSGTPLRLRPEPELRRELERWFAVYWRMRLRLIGVERLDLARWVADNPSLTVLTAADVPLIDGDLSLDQYVMEVARDDPAADAGTWRLVLVDQATGEPLPDAPDKPDDDWPVENGRVPIRVCTAGMLSAGENVLRVASERLQALRWLLGATEQLGEDPPGHYEPDSPAAFDKGFLYRDDRYAARGGLPWCHAAWTGDVTRLRSLIDDGTAATFTADIDGDLAIHCAVRGGHRGAVELLFAEDGPMVHTLRDGAGRTALDLAAARGDIDLIDAIVGAAGPDPAWSGGPLVEAVRAGHADAAVHLIELGLPLDGALDAAVATDRPDLVRCLAAHGATVDGYALYQAAGNGQFASAATLVDLGADVHFADGSGTTVLHLAADRGSTDLCLRLLDAGADPNTRLGDFGAVHFAILGGHADTALALIDRGADVTGTDQSLISIAVRGGSADLVRWCLDRGEVPDPDAVQTAVLNDRPDVLRTLVDAGQPVDTANQSGITPLHLAADRGYQGCLEILLAAGAPPDPVVPGQGSTALDLARMHDHEECVRLLVAAGAPDSR